ncbi:MAG: hypothetical protein ACYCVD_19680 [Desulfitobacteriaceae bacterium]
MSIFEIEIDFLSDWASILSNVLVAKGYRLSDNEDICKISHRYFNLQKRLIAPNPRRIFIANEFSCPSEYLAGLEVLKDKIQKGEDLRTHLSRKISNLDYNDSLLNDWGIYHLHLGSELDNNGFIKRTGPVLFARFDDSNAYFINVMPHGTWSNQEMPKILHSNWPNSISHYRLKSDGVEVNLTDAEINMARKGNVQTIIEVQHGVVYAPIGGGYTTSGISIDAVMMSYDYLRRIKTFEDQIKSNINELAANASKQGYNLGEKLKFNLWINHENQVFALEHYSGLNLIWKELLIVDRLNF